MISGCQRYIVEVRDVGTLIRDARDTRDALSTRDARGVRTPCIQNGDNWFRFQLAKLIHYELIIKKLNPLLGW